ncbi:MAG: DNA polymerase III subunit beta, partial [Candidatus Poribacteria bacterium]|nr:DNA polymerase III subunit beta [Candidatus Poribacteria bacterium]
MRYNSSMYTDLTDEELIELVQDGNEIAFGQLADRHSFRIWQLVVLNSRQTRDAEEIFQDIWIAVWENINGLRKVSSFGAWLQKIAYTACRRYYTQKSHTSSEILQGTDQLAETMDQDALARFREMELRWAVREAVYHLPEKVRSVAVSYYLEMSTVKEIAAELNLAVGTVKTRLREIRTLLRTEFGVEAPKSGTTIRVPEQEAPKPASPRIKEGFEMELTLARDDLLRVLQGLQTVTIGQSDAPIHASVLIRTEAGAIDLEVNVKTKIEGIVKTQGTITVPAQKLIETLNTLSTDMPVDLVKTASNTVEIRCGDRTYKITDISGETFPQPISVESETFALSGQTLRDVIHKTAYAAATEDKRSFLKGLYFNFLENRTEIVATDGKRLALACADPIDLQEKTNGFIVPLKTVQELPKIFSESIEVHVSVSGNQIRFTDGDATLTTELVDREYPNYHKIIPQNSKDNVVVSRKQLLRVTQHIGQLANPKDHKIRLEIDTEQIRVSTKTSKPEAPHETVPVESGTGCILIGFDARLLADALAHIETEFVAIEFSRKLDPVLIQPMDDDRYIALIMPIQARRPSRHEAVPDRRALQ